MKYSNHKKCVCGHSKTAHTNDCTNTKQRIGNVIIGSQCRQYLCDCAEFSPVTKQLKRAEHQSYESR